MTIENQEDIQRLRAEYARREENGISATKYSRFNPVQLFLLQNRERALLELLRKHSITDLSNLSICEIGCGSGGVLQELLTFGVDREKLFGIDLLYPRLTEAGHRLPLACFACADGQMLPFPSHSFDLMLQFTAFSSILSLEVKQAMAAEILRVLQPQGILLWYDFWLNPTNPQTKGIPPKEIASLFPHCALEFHKITLAPPLARSVVPFSWPLAMMLDSLKIFNSHYLVFIQKK
jgi:ubiquinone/menaquinone biosynthesis C-methylase UbiE